MSALAALALLQAAAGELPPLHAPAVPAPQAAPAAPAETCADKLYAGFDFWLGSWNVFTKNGGALVGTSRVEKQNGGCTVREVWAPLQGQPGGSVNAPDLITGRWHQYWTDRSGQRVDLEGGVFRGTMVLAGPWRGGGGTGSDTMLRLTYTPLDADSVRQLAEISDDGGLTWQVNFDHLYLRTGRAD